MNFFQEKLKSDMLDTVQQKLKYYETYLRGKEWLMGDKVWLFPNLSLFYVFLHFISKYNLLFTLRTVFTVFLIINK